MPTRQSSEIMAISPGSHASLSKYRRLIARKKGASCLDDDRTPLRREPRLRAQGTAVLIDHAWSNSGSRAQLGFLHRHLLDIARDDEVCRRLMRFPGSVRWWPLAISASVDVPARYRNSKAVRDSLGLTP